MVFRISNSAIPAVSAFWLKSRVAELNSVKVAVLVLKYGVEDASTPFARSPCNIGVKNELSQTCASSEDTPSATCNALQILYVLYTLITWTQCRKIRFENCSTCSTCTCLSYFDHFSAVRRHIASHTMWSIRTAHTSKAPHPQKHLRTQRLLWNHRFLRYTRCRNMWWKMSLPNSLTGHQNATYTNENLNKTTRH